MTPSIPTSVLTALAAIDLFCARILGDLTDDSPFGDPHGDDDDEARPPVSPSEHTLDAIADHAVLATTAAQLQAVLQRGLEQLSVEVDDEVHATFLSAARTLLHHHLGGDHATRRDSQLVAAMCDTLDELIDTGSADPELLPAWGTVHVMGHTSYTGQIREVDGLIEVVTPAVGDPERWVVDLGTSPCIVRRPAHTSPRLRRLVGRGALHSVDALSESDARREIYGRSMGFESTTTAIPWPHEDRDGRQVPLTVAATTPHPGDPEDELHTLVWLTDDDGTIVVVDRKQERLTDEFGRPFFRDRHLTVAAAYHPNVPWGIHLYSPNTYLPALVARISDPSLARQVLAGLIEVDAEGRAAAAHPRERLAQLRREHKLSRSKGTPPGLADDFATLTATSDEPTTAADESTTAVRTEDDARAAPMPGDRWSTVGGYYTLTRQGFDRGFPTWFGRREVRPGHPDDETSGWIPGMRGETFLGNFAAPTTAEPVDGEVTRG